jgi:8-oxo-dGTP diphosphatase
MNSQSLTLQAALATPGNEHLCPAAFLWRDGRIVVGLRHYAAGDAKADRWTTPGGRCEAGETVGETVFRETSEEVGLTDLEAIAYLGEVPGGRDAADRVPVFVFTTAGEPNLMEPDKFSAWAWYPLDDIPKPFINPAALVLVRAWDAAGRA